MTPSRCWLIAAAALPWPSALCAQAPSVALDAPALRPYVREVLARNAGYQAATSLVAAASERIAPAGALPDPTFTTGVMAVPVPSFSFTDERMSRVALGVQQRFPFPGKQRAATAVARADRALHDEIAGAVEAELAAAAAGAYYDLADAATALAVWRRRVDLADQAVQIARVRYETGATPQTDPLRARLRRAQLEEERRRLEATLAGARELVDALRGGAGDSVTPIGLLRPDGGPSLDVTGDTLPPDTALARQLGERSPALLVATAEVVRAEREARVFAVAARPDFTVSVENGVRFGGREPFLTALVGISIPLYAGRKQAPAARAAELEARAAQQRHADLLARFTGELRSRIADLTALQDRIRLTAGEILPLAEAASTSALQRYRVGAVEFTSVLDTQDDLFRAQLRLARLIADYGTTRARLAALVGEEWYR